MVTAIPLDHNLRGKQELIVESHLIANLNPMTYTKHKDLPKQVLVHLTQELIDLLKSQVVAFNSIRLHSNDFEFIQCSLPEKFWPLFSWFTSPEFEHQALDWGFDEEYAHVMTSNHPLIEEGVRIAKENPSQYMVYPYYRIYALGAISICAEVEDGSGSVEVDIESRFGFFLT